MAGRSPRQAAPEPVAYVRDLLRGFGPSWFLCGGWAADAWLGRQTRHHWDVDISVFLDDQHAIFHHFTGWALVAHDPNVPGDTKEPWNGRHLDAPAHIHVPTLGSSLATSTTATHTAFEFEFLLDERSGGEWILNRTPRVAVPLDRGIEHSPWGLPVAAPEVVLFFKAGGNVPGADLDDVIRPHDEQDFLALLPTLTPARRTWLRESLRSVWSEHPWLPRL